MPTAFGELIEFLCSMINYINSIKKFLIGSHKKKKRNSLIILKKLNKDIILRKELIFKNKNCILYI